MEKNQMEQTLVDLAISLLERQLKLAKKCGLTLSSIKESIEKKDFESMETSLNDFNACSIKLNLIEEERSSVFEQLSSMYHLRAGSGFKELIHKVPVSTRKQFEDLYLSLKFNISTLQSTIWVIDSYIRNISSVLYSVLDNIYPGKNTSVYSKKGNYRGASDCSPILLNVKV